MDPLLTPDTVPAHLAAQPELAAALDLTGPVDVREVGDGNLNLVFVVRDAGGRSLVLKQSLPHVRTDPGWPMTRERTAREARVLTAHGRLDLEHVPALLHHDPVRQVLAIEDLSDHRVWRTMLCERTAATTDDRALDRAAAAELGRYVARTGFGTSVHGLGTAGHKAAVAASMNPELSQITEDLVLTEPFVTHPHNRVHPDNEPDLAALVADPRVGTAVGLARLAFMTRVESLLHGDLHTGSVFVRPGEPASVRAFDAEFGAYGPLGFDVGVLWGNLVLAAARAGALGRADDARALLDLGAVTWTAFEQQWRELWPGRVDPRLLGEAVLETTLAAVWADAVTYAGAEVARRVIGFAKVADVETLAPAQRVVAARGALRATHELLVHRGDARAGRADVLRQLASGPLGL